MNLVKTSENTTKQYANDGTVKELLTAANFNVVDGTTNLGNINISQNGFNMNINNLSNVPMEDLESKISEFLNKLKTTTDE